MDLKTELQLYWNDLWGLIFPQGVSCMICGGPLDQKRAFEICQGCDQKLPYVKRGRWIQSHSLGDGASMRMFSVMEYDGMVAQLVYRLKYQQQTYLARNLGKMMAAFLLREAIPVDLLVPVPLHRRRLLHRGFNQAQLLVKYMSESLHVPWTADLLARVKDTRAMHRLTRQERRQNITNAFVLNKPYDLQGLDILLVDDILTTGSTVEACGKILIEAGARSVTVLTFARSLKRFIVGSSKSQLADQDAYEREVISWN